MQLHFELVVSLSTSGDVRREAVRNLFAAELKELCNGPDAKHRRTVTFCGADDISIYLRTTEPVGALDSIRRSLASLGLSDDARVTCRELPDGPLQTLWPVAPPTGS
jgi:hypothetical protein